ncbi:MAG: ABC transporter ATP-binding protein [Rhodospirillaceae bacterium]|nr:ABC transporter ATP-binding protein [Rhodospirillaceae bacterium]
MTPPLLLLSGIRFAYPGCPPILDQATLSLAPGQRLAVNGDNGAGKTTLLKLMVGLLKPQAGTIWAFGVARRCEADFREVRARAGLLFQDPDDQLFCPTVAEDVAFGPINLGKSPAEANAIARRVLAGLGIDSLSDHAGHRLSTGQKKLAALASVLAMEPEILLLDEPSAGLDRTARTRLFETLRVLPQAMILVSHDAAFRDGLADSHVLLSEGRLIPDLPEG